jgi:uncharacterized cupin superfamily protein/catechol 2,3-dioxygenase-like lactoylglutathione lyase family enzyme
MTITEQSVVPVGRELATDRASSRAWWFLGTLAVLRNPAGAPRTPVVLELVVPPGGSPPRHVHTALDDSFLLLEGEVVVRCADRTVLARPGSYVVLPHGVEHTFRVTSPGPARLLLVHADDSFLAFVEELGSPTTELVLPPADLDGVGLERIVEASAEHGAPIVGPSLEEDEVREYVGAADTGVGPVNHLSVRVTDLRRSVDWYVAAFDLVQVDGEVADDGTGHVILLSRTGGWLVSLGSADEAGFDHVAFTCPDRSALVAQRDELARRALAPGTITDAPYGSGFVVRDPDGLELELFAPPAG